MIKKVFIALGIGLILFLAYSLTPSALNEKILTKAKEEQAQFNSDYAILIDYSLPVFARRLWLVNLKTDSVLLNCHVSHAHRSGLIYAADLSNEVGSNKSCIGKFITQEAYTGSYGYSMRIAGLENGVNDKAHQRNIVFHPVVKPKLAGLPLPEFTSLYSNGCFATLEDNMKLLVDKTADGSLVLVMN